VLSHFLPGKDMDHSRTTVLSTCVHSLLASKSARDGVAALVGTRRREAYCRAVYNAQALGATVYLVLRMRRLPDGLCTKSAV
jgi:hypothetical protein